MKRFKNHFLSWCAATLFLTVVLSACAPNPTQEIVINKNDGSFDIGVLQTDPGKAGDATNALDETAATDVTDTTVPTEAAVYKAIQHMEPFTSTDKSVEFAFNIDQSIIDQTYPVVEVCPHMFTGDDAQTIANALFGNLTFYEAAPTLGEIKDIFSKAEMRSAIQRWSTYTNKEALIKLIPKLADRSALMDMYLQRIKGDVADFSLLLEEIPEENIHPETKWEFQPEWRYMYTEEQVPADRRNSKGNNQQICVTTTVGDIPYRLNFTTNNGSAYKLNTIFAYPGTVYSPMGVDNDIFIAQLCRTKEPTETQIENVKKKAVETLNSMGIGLWEVANYSLNKSNEEGSASYVITINAVPVFEGVAAMYRTQLDNLSENFSASYYLTEAFLQFSANGDLVNLRLSSPVDIVNVVNKNVAIMDINELLERTKNHLSLSDKNAYGLSGQLLQDYQKSAGEDFICKIELSKLDFGLIRVKVAGSKENYYYIPGMIVYGSVDYCGKDSGEIYVSSGRSLGAERVIPLVALNAIDGSIIDLNNG